MIKKIIAMALATGLIGLSGMVASAQTATTSPAVQNYLSQLGILRQLRLGMSGSDVSELQSILASDPSIYPEGLVTGTFGPLTAQAVKKFQARFGLSQVGQVGPMTLEKLNEVLGDEGTSTQETEGGPHGAPCMAVPPGHLIAPGFLKKIGEDNNGRGQGHDNQGDRGDDNENHVGTSTQMMPTNPPCHPLPPGILIKLGSSTPIIRVCRPGELFNSMTGAPCTATSTAPLTLSSITLATTTATSSTITWMTNNLATSKVLFGTSTPVIGGVSTQNVTSSNVTLSHSITLTNLSTSTLYHYVVSSTDTTNATVNSGEFTFTTLPQ